MLLTEKTARHKACFFKLQKKVDAVRSGSKNRGGVKTFLTFWMSTSYTVNADAIWANASFSRIFLHSAFAFDSHNLMTASCNSRVRRAHANRVENDEL